MAVVLNRIRSKTPLLVAVGALALPQIAKAQATVAWGAAQGTSGPSDVALGGMVVEARTGLVYVPYLSDNPAEDVNVAGVVFDATNYLGQQFVNEPPGSFLSNHTSNNAAYDQLIANLSSCDGPTLGNGSTDAVANYSVNGLTVNEEYLVQVWYTDVRAGSNARAITIDGSVTLQSGLSSAPTDLGQFAVGTFTASATTQILNFDSGGTSGRAAISAILVRVRDGSVTSLGVDYCGPAVSNASGGPATLGAFGNIRASENDVTLAASGLPVNSFGLFVTGQTVGFVANPGGSAGNLCLGGAIGRYQGPGQIQSSGLSGMIELQIDLTSTPQPSGSVAVGPGDTWNFQTWFRDTTPSGIPTSNFTNGLQIAFL